MLKVLQLVLQRGRIREGTGFDNGQSAMIKEMASRARTSHDTIPAPESVAPRTRFMRPPKPSQEPFPVPFNPAVYPRSQTALESAASRPGRGQAPRGSAKKRFVLAFLCITVFLITAAATFLLAYYRDHRSEAEATAHRAVDEVKQALGERGPVWWGDGSPDLNSHLVTNTLYADWYAKLACTDRGGL